MLEVKPIAIEFADRRRCHDHTRRVRELDDVERQQHALAEGGHKPVIRGSGESEKVDLRGRRCASNDSYRLGLRGGEYGDLKKRC